MSTGPTDPDVVSEEDLPDNWIEEKSDAVKDVLGELTSVYNEENERLDLQYASRSHADIDGEYVAVNPHFWQEVDPPVHGPNILRVLDELLSHETGHYNWSDLSSKKDFGECYPGWGEIPGHVANILEDEYVDARKMREWYGLRSKRAYRVKLQYHTDRFTPPIPRVEFERGKAQALVTALHQTAIYGAVKGIEDASPEIAEFCAQIEPVINRVRTQDDPNERFKLFHVAMQILMRHVDDPDEFDDEEFREGPGATVSGEPEESPEADEPEMDVPESFEGMLEEMLEEMAGEDGEIEGIAVEVVDEPGGEPEEGDGGEGGEESADDGEEDSEEEPKPGDISIDVDELDVESDDGDAGSGGDELESEESDEPDDLSDGSKSDSAEGESEPGTAEEGDSADESEGTASDGPHEATEPDELDEDGSPPTSDIDGGEAKHHIGEEFAEREFEDELRDRYDIRLDEIDKVDNRDRARWASLVRELQDYDLDVEIRKRERDHRIEERQTSFEDSYREERLSPGLKTRAENAGVIDELEDGFRELVSRDAPKPSRRGTRIDAMNVARRAAGDVTTTELFEEEVVVETGDRCVGFATDISGSMSSGIDSLKIAGAAVARATEIIGDEFVWEAFTDQYGTGEERLDLRIVTGPNEEFDWEHLDSFGAARNEPTAAGIRDCFQLMQLTDANEYVMIVVTDGIALVREDGEVDRASNVPVEQAREAVNEVRAQGVDVIGLGIGSMDDQKMEETFGGKNYRLTDIDTLADDILDLYKRQLDTVKTRGR